MSNRLTVLFCFMKAVKKYPIFMETKSSLPQLGKSSSIFCPDLYKLSPRCPILIYKDLHQYPPFYNNISQQTPTKGEYVFLFCQWCATCSSKVFKHGLYKRFSFVVKAKRNLSKSRRYTQQKVVLNHQIKDTSI